MISAQFKYSLLLYAVQTLEKVVDIFIRDRALKDCLVQKSIWQLFCYIDTSVDNVIYMHLECSWSW